MSSSSSGRSSDLRKERWRSSRRKSPTVTSGDLPPKHAGSNYIGRKQVGQSTSTPSGNGDRDASERGQEGLQDRDRTNTGRKNVFQDASGELEAPPSDVFYFSYASHKGFLSDPLRGRRGSHNDQKVGHGGMEWP
ncbi:unnamed protein product [Sphagnum jensenii]|uniref:Uncharacterized protein n=1 Tax=Sphagnum jensenii TaxID=128206 RepID=A0ABP0VQN3_9BRYO